MNGRKAQALSHVVRTCLILQTQFDQSEVKGQEEKHLFTSRFPCGRDLP